MAPRKRLSLFDCIAIGVNGIVGSGIFLLPGWVAAGAGALSPFAFLACGALCALVALCYAEVGGMFDRSGGTYLYAREAFGDTVGFGVGWLVLVSAVLGYATVASGLGSQIVRMLGLPAWSGPAIAAAIIVGLGAANWRGIKTGALTSDALIIVKLGALVLFVAVGLFFVRGANFSAAATPSLSGFAEGTFSALFAVSGFEFVAVVAGETDNPRRNIPLAILGSLLGTVILYALIQTVAVGVVPDLPGADDPLGTAARIFGGGGAALAIGVAAIVSMIGFCSSSALVGPQLVAALARDGVLPSVVTWRHPERNTPDVAIGLVTVAATAAVLLLDFKALADLTIITLFCQYVPTCLALIVFRRWMPDAPRGFRVPFGATIPLVALGVMGLLVTRIELKALATTAVILAVGVVVVALTQQAERRKAPRPETEPR